MLIKIMPKLVPYIIFYFGFVCFFAITFMTLGTEIDDEVAAAKGISHAETMFIQVFRSSVGELATPGYLKLTAQDSKIANFNICLIWLVWLFSVFFMIVIMVNFLIAVISDKYN